MFIVLFLLPLLLISDSTSTLYVHFFLFFGLHIIVADLAVLLFHSATSIQWK